MRVPQQILDSVVFVCARSSTEQPFAFGGTAFFLSMESEAQAGARFCYLVTAKHNVQKAKAAGQLFISINTRDGGGGALEITQDWFYPEEEGIDVAVTPLHLDRERAEIRAFRREDCLTEELAVEYDVCPGEDVAMVGLFTQHPGKSRNKPIVRRGCLAMVPPVTLEDGNTGLEYHAYLVEAHSIGGLSGSPVLLSAWEPRDVRGRRVWPGISLMGLLRGHWKFSRGQWPPDPRDELNAGIAEVTPIADVLRLLDSDELVRLRRRSSPR